MLSAPGRKWVNEARPRRLAASPRVRRTRNPKIIHSRPPLPERTGKTARFLHSQTIEFATGVMDNAALSAVGTRRLLCKSGVIRCDRQCCWRCFPILKVAGIAPELKLGLTRK